MRLKVISERGQTRVVDAESGDTLHGVVSVRFEHLSDDQSPRLNIIVEYFDAELTAEAEVEHRPAG